MNNFNLSRAIALFVKSSNTGEEVVLACSQPRYILMLLLTFINRFRVYRNSYRTLIGIYIINVALRYRERIRRANVLPLTLGPYSSNFADVYKALKGSVVSLEQGLTIKIKDEDVFVYVFTLIFISDIP